MFANTDPFWKKHKYAVEGPTNMKKSLYIFWWCQKQCSTSSRPKTRLRENWGTRLYSRSVENKSWPWKALLVSRKHRVTPRKTKRLVHLKISYNWTGTSDVPSTSILGVPVHNLPGCIYNSYILYLIYEIYQIISTWNPKWGPLVLIRSFGLAFGGCGPFKNRVVMSGFQVYIPSHATYSPEI